MLEASVVIFTCDRPNDLKRCLDSVGRQSRKDFELLVINNGSAIEAEEVLKRYNLRVIKDSTRRLSYLFNLGWKNTRNEIIVYLADDVELEEDWLEEGLAALSRHPEAAVVTGPLVSPYEFTGQMHALHTQAQNNLFLKLFVYVYDNFILEGKAFWPCLLFESGAYTMGQGFRPDFVEDRNVDLATTSAMIFRRSVIQEIGGFDENFCFNHADGDLFIRLKKHGHSIAYIPAMQAKHYNQFGPSRDPYYIGRDTAYFYLKDIRPKSLREILAALVNIVILNMYWVYKSIQTRDQKQLSGITGFFKGFYEYLMQSGVK